MRESLIIILAALLAAVFFGAAPTVADDPAPSSSLAGDAAGMNVKTPPTQLALQRVQRPKRGNCFYWKGCRGDSIGTLWVQAPEYCAILGGKSWKDFDGKCRDLPEGPRATEPIL